MCPITPPPPPPFHPLSLLLLLLTLSPFPPLPCPQFFTDSWLFKLWKNYFYFEWELEELLDPNQKYLFAEFPHGEKEKEEE